MFSLCVIDVVAVTGRSIGSRLPVVLKLRQAMVSSTRLK
uniref:Uncharacterized protein n=1 Tax=Mycobacterium avium subsp. hominissuis TaxID=439334 RepID=A0A088DIR1_MYCAV|nr:hypothetical protein [Mycobacterium avium subsp. hominissuis]